MTDGVAPDLGWELDTLMVCRKCGETFGVNVTLSSPAAVTEVDLTVHCPGCGARGKRMINVISELLRSQG